MGLDHGVIVEEVKKGGPADKAGLRAEDIILGINGQPIKDGWRDRGWTAKLAWGAIGLAIVVAGLVLAQRERSRHAVFRLAAPKVLS